MEFPFSNIPSDKDSVLLASIERSILILAITGKVNIKAYKNLQILTESLNYAIFRFEFGDDSYREKIKVLKDKISKLQKECKEICSSEGLPVKENFCGINIK